MKRKKIFSIYLLAILFVSTGLAAKNKQLGSKVTTPQNKALRAIESDHLAEHKKIFASAKKNADKINHKTTSRAFTNNQVGFDADLKTDVILGKGLELFSDKNYDSYLFSLFTLDLGVHAKQFTVTDEPRYHFKAAIRTKNIVGNTGNFSLLESKPIKIGLGRTESEISLAPNKYMMAWFREAWLQYIFSEKYKSSLKVGFFPFQVGQGIALGNAHQLGRIVTGMDRQHDVDQHRFGLNVSGEFAPNKLGYEAYFGVIDRNSAHFQDTAQITQAQRQILRQQPYRGEFTNNVLAAFQLTFKPSIKDANVFVKPYIIANRDDEQQIEYLGDARSVLGILGCETTINKGKLTLHFETALNTGFQYAYAWDRNSVFYASKPYHLYMFQDFGEPGTPKWRVAERTPYPDSLGLDNDNGVIFRDQVDSGIRYKNAYNRFRRAYKNKYSGFFVTADASYEYVYNDQSATTIGAAGGFISGDNHPNDTYEMLLARRLDGTCTDACPGCYQDCSPNHCFKDVDKLYTGFVGLEQLYSGNTVKSYFMMEAHKLNQPLSAKESMVTYPQMNNLAFLGLGATYKQRSFDRVFDISVNGLIFCTPYKEEKGFNYTLDTFFKLNSCGEQETRKLLPTLKADAAWELSRFLGAELNGALYYQFDPNLRFYAQGALFIPGLYYQDAERKIIRLTEQFKLASTDYSGYEMDSRKYRYELGKSSAMFVNVGFEYHFST